MINLKAIPMKLPRLGAPGQESPAVLGTQSQTFAQAA